MLDSHQPKVKTPGHMPELRDLNLHPEPSQLRGALPRELADDGNRQHTQFVQRLGRLNEIACDRKSRRSPRQFCPKGNTTAEEG
jgi:hypothetical protein